jgi:membrane protein
MGEVLTFTKITALLHWIGTERQICQLPASGQSERPVSKIGFVLSEIWAVLVETIEHWSNDNAMRMAAALAFYTTFSVGPVLLFGLWIAGFFVGAATAKSELTHQIQQMISPDSADYLFAVLDSFWGELKGNRLPIIGFGAALLSATAVFVELQSSLNNIWGVHSKGGFRILYERAVSFIFVVGFGVLLIFSITASAVLAGANAILEGLVHIPGYLIEGLNVLVTFAMIPALLALTYKLVPETPIAWKDVWLGAAVASLLFLVGKFAFGMYLRMSVILSVYGAAGSLVVLIIWVYYSAQVFFFGAELTKVYAMRYGSKKESEQSVEPV